MTLLSRAVTTGVSLVWNGLFDKYTGMGSGYTVVNNKGATGAKLSVGGFFSNLYQNIKNELSNSLKSLSAFYMEDLASELFVSDMYKRLNSIEWSDTRLWEIRIDGLPRPFTGFCPAVNANLQVMNIDVGSFKIGTTSWNYIEGQGLRTIQIDFIDDVTGTMEEFFYAWMDEISGKKAYGVMPINKAGKLIKFRKLSRGKYVTSQLNLYCIPTGGLRFDNNQSSSSPRQISIDFAVLGIERFRVQQTFPFRDLAHLAAVATANLARRNKYAQRIRSAYNRYEPIINYGRNLVS